MKTGLTLSQLAERIESNQAKKKDIVAPAKVTTMVVNEHNKTALEVPDQGRFPVLPVAAGQIGSRLGIPAKYYSRMEAEAPDLLASNVNRWLGESDDTRMLRTLDGDLRAYLSDRYQRIEHEEIAAIALPILMNRGDVTVRSCEITERRLYIQAIFNNIVSEVRGGVVPNDIVRAGVIITNSEVGLGAYNILPLIDREWCTNGCVINDGAMRKRHLGRQQAAGELVDFSDETKRSQDETLMLESRDTIEACADEATFAMRVNSMSELTGAKIEGDPIKAVEVLAQKVNATQDESAGILRKLIEGGDLSAWGLLNAVTAQAHDDGVTYDRSVEFEAAGGQLLDLSPKEWEPVLLAA
jgi:hypothetical protein